MRCPYCSRIDDKVIDSRTAREGEVIRRRRECLKCKRRFTTYERIEENLPVLVKKDNRRETFDRSKIMAGLKKAVIGALTLLVTAGAGWVATNVFGGGSDTAEVVSPPPIEVNINNENNQTQAAPTVGVIESTDTVEAEETDPAKKKPKW